MKIECDKCSAKYSIADEKVRGKTFKIRCKKCSNVIIVRDKGVAAAAAAGGGGGYDAAQDEVADAPGWHLAINGETVGPMHEDEVRQRYEAGEIDKDTAVWQEGFEDWIPLGDVEVFAALPDRPAAAVDPFVSANQDDYAATGTGGAIATGAASATASALAGGGERQRQPTSPRVSQLTGQRNENSVLFSLDSLQAIATGGGGAGAAARSPVGAPAAARASANPSKGLATSAPSSEGSGLIDIRALGAMVGNEAAAPAATAAPNRAADDAALPSFGGAGFGALSAAPLVAHPAPVEAAAAAALAAAIPQQRSNAPLYIMMIILILAVVGLAGFILLREQTPQIVKEQVPGVAPSVADGADDKDKDKAKDKDDEDKDKDKDKDDKDKDDGDKAAGDSEEPEPDPDAKPDATSKKTTSGKKTTGKTGSSSSSSSSDPLSGSSSTPTTKKEEPEDLPVECIIDPKSCKGGKPKSSSSSSTTPPKGDSSLPETLSQADIKAGVAPHKDAAKSCGGKHGAPAGEKVTVQLSISGPSGTVSSATATGKHAGTALGNCVAAALKKATFKKVQKPQIGAQYPITM